MSASAHRYTCDELGACQSRVNPCAGCKPFAPGAITRHVHPQRRALARWLRRTALLMSLAAAAVALAGIVYGALQ
jgi:hypothetical protein